MPLSLTDHQLNLVTKSASLLPIGDRPAYLRSLANRLGDVVNPTDRDVQAAVDFVLTTRGITGGRDFRPPKSKTAHDVQQQVERLFK